MKFFLFFFICLSPLAFYSQSEDLCTEDKKLAERLIKNDSLQLYDPFGFPISPTFMYVLNNEYKIYTRIFWTEKKEFLSHDCYINEMKFQVELKHGVGIIDKIRLYADSLDSLGMGYKHTIPPNEFMNRLVEIIPELSFIDAKYSDIKNIIVSVSVTESGVLDRITCSGYVSKDSLRFSCRLKPKSERSLFEQLQSYSWQPARFKGKYIKSDLNLPISISKGNSSAPSTPRK